MFVLNESNQQMFHVILNFYSLIATWLQIDEYQYDITADSIHEVFKRYGNVQKIAIFQKNNVWQALVQYPDPQVCP